MPAARLDYLRASLAACRTSVLLTAYFALALPLISEAHLVLVKGGHFLGFMQLIQEAETATEGALIRKFLQ